LDTNGHEILQHYHFFNKNNTANLTAKLIEANEVTSRMDLSKLEELHELAEHFEEKLEDIEHLFVGKLDNQIHDVAHALEDEFNHMSVSNLYNKHGTGQ
jgi:hypothetical protein